MRTVKSLAMNVLRPPRVHRFTGQGTYTVRHPPFPTIQSVEVVSGGGSGEDGDVGSGGTGGGAGLYRLYQYVPPVAIGLNSELVVSITPGIGHGNTVTLSGFPFAEIEVGGGPDGDDVSLPPPPPPLPSGVTQVAGAGSHAVGSPPSGLTGGDGTDTPAPINASGGAGGGEDADGVDGAFPGAGGGGGGGGASAGVGGVGGGPRVILLRK